mmetsp:Transcript_17930/g.38172  ORF Transcript_17930/g.38172 Transcript_17930/m.38172 type:complete len:225 (+) Transcript_17930:1521-2195(+)
MYIRRLLFGGLVLHLVRLALRRRPVLPHGDDGADRLLFLKILVDDGVDVQGQSRIWASSTPTTEHDALEGRSVLPAPMLQHARHSIDGMPDEISGPGHPQDQHRKHRLVRLGRNLCPRQLGYEAEAQQQPCVVAPVLIPLHVAFLLELHHLYRRPRGVQTCNEHSCLCRHLQEGVALLVWTPEQGDIGALDHEGVILCYEVLLQACTPCLDCQVLRSFHEAVKV